MKRIAYLINQYPAISHTFVRREIQALERLGFHVSRYSIRPTRTQLVDPEDREELGKTRALLSAFPCLLAMVRMLVTRPARLAKATRLTWKLYRQAGRGVVRHIAYLAEAARLASLLEQEHAEHLHAHFGTNSASVAMLAHALGGPPYSFTVHGPEEFDRPEHESLELKIQRSKFAVAISSFGRSQLQRWCDPEYWSRLHVVHCGLSESFLARPVKDVPSTRQLVCVGRLARQKGHFLLLEAVRLLAERKVAPFEIVLVGDGPLREGLERVAREHRIEGYLKFAGWQSESQIQDWLEKSRALVLPSSAEGLPVSIMESLAIARPVITTYVAGIPELILPGQHGWLVPSGDAERLADAIAECLDASPAQLQAMGLAGKQRVTERHNILTEAQKLAKCL